MTKITIITKADCAFCEQAKELLERLAPELDLEVERIGLDTPQGRDLALASGMLFPPAVLLEDQPLSYGRLSERLLRLELARRRAAEWAPISVELKP